MTDMNVPYIKELIRLRYMLNSPVADFGGHNGDLSKYITSEKSYGLTVLNLDQHENADIKVNFENMIPIRDNFFNSGYCLHVLEHIKNLDNFLNEIKRIISSDGYIIFITPNGHAFDGPGHIHYWNLEEITKILSGYFSIFKAYELPSDKGNLVIICKVIK